MFARFRHSRLVWTIVLSSLLMGLAPVSATVALPRIFGDNMVLQRDMPVPVWGWADKGEEVTVTLGSAIALGQGGRRRPLEGVLPHYQAGGPLEMTVKGASGSGVIFKNVLVGEVWVCSGQSNMEKPIGPHPGQKPCPN